MLETIREYGTERLDEHAETGGAGQRHAAYYLALAESAAAAWPARTPRPGWRGWMPSMTTCGPRCAGRWTGATG